MKKLVPLCGLLCLLLSQAEARNGYDEIGYMIFKYGMTSIKDDINFEEHTFAVDFIGEVGHDIKPKLDLSYVHINTNDTVDYLLQGSLNAYLKSNYGYSSIYPYVYGGFGYEYVSDSRNTFDSSFYLQGAAGLEIPISSPEDDLHVITEIRYMQMVGSGNGQDNETALFIGLSLPIGDTFSYYGGVPAATQSQSYAEFEDAIPQPALPKTTTPEATIAARTTSTQPELIADEDGDGVKDSMDICPHTPMGVAVNLAGCPLKDKLYVEPKTLTSETTTSSFTILPKTRKILNIHFQLNSDVIEPESRETIRELVTAINNTQTSKIVVEGYTDSTGTYAQNMALSQKRAEAVKRLMVQYGVDAGRITAAGKGPVNPIASNDTEVGRAQNRRIEIILE